MGQLDGDQRLLLGGNVIGLVPLIFIKRALFLRIVCEVTSRK